MLHWEGYIRRMHTGRYLVPVWTTNFFTLLHFLGTLVAGTKGSVGIWYQSIEHITGSLGTRYQYSGSVLGTWYCVPGTRVPGTLVPGSVLGTWYCVPGTRSQVPGT